MEVRQGHLYKIFFTFVTDDIIILLTKSAANIPKLTNIIPLYFSYIISLIQINSIPIIKIAGNNSPIDLNLLFDVITAEIML